MHRFFGNVFFFFSESIYSPSSETPIRPSEMTLASKVDIKSPLPFPSAPWPNGLELTSLHITSSHDSQSFVKAIAFVYIVVLI